MLISSIDWWMCSYRWSETSQAIEKHNTSYINYHSLKFLFYVLKGMSQRTIAASIDILTVMSYVLSKEENHF